MQSRYLQGDALHGAGLDTLEQVRREASDPVADLLGGDLSHLGEDLLVQVEVGGQLHVVLLDEDLGGLLDGLISNSAHVLIFLFF